MVDKDLVIVLAVLAVVGVVALASVANITGYAVKQISVEQPISEERLNIRDCLTSCRDWSRISKCCGLYCAAINQRYLGFSYEQTEPIWNAWYACEKRFYEDVEDTIEVFHKVNTEDV